MRWLVLGESYHPGGPALTRRRAGALGLRPGQRVVDVASGPGSTARLLAAEFGVAVDGVDLSESMVKRARSATGKVGLSRSVRFHLGDAERIPLPDAIADALVCECAFCMFPDKTIAAAEFARLLRPGGRVGITDVTVADDGLPEELSTLAAWVACIADARPVTQYTDILATAGIATLHVEAHDDALARMIEQIEARLDVEGSVLEGPAVRPLPRRHPAASPGGARNKIPSLGPTLPPPPGGYRPPPSADRASSPVSDTGGTRPTRIWGEGRRDRHRFHPPARRGPVRH
ncbi:MAG: methyltransferase domain-containing protein [Pseudonocardiaceae bacterium]